MAKPGRLQPKPSGEFSRFTNRESQQVLFLQYLTSVSEVPVLMFYGVGGAGKTWLLQKLKEQVPADIPVAFLDFDMAAGGHRFLADPAAGLYEIRNQLGQAAPRFDLAYAMLRHKQGVVEEPAFKGAGAAGLAWELIASVVQDSFKAVPGVGVVLGRLGKPLRKKIEGTAFERLLASSTGNDFLLVLRSQNSQDIGNGLVGYLAEDLRESFPPVFNRAVRAVLFFDTFEAVYHGLLSTEHQRFQEQWIRDVAANFDFALTVIAGQNRLSWDEIDPGWSDHLSQHPVSGLSEPDARSFLGKCNITAAALQNAILATSREGDDGFHCFSLGLCADIVYAERRSGREPEPGSLHLGPGDWTNLARRFLKSLGSDQTRRWIERLAITPRFDEPAGRKAFSSEPSAAQDVEWETLPDFTFVEPLTNPWFSIRAEMRRALENQPSTRERVAADHEWWRAYWKARSQSNVDLFASLAWYHRYTIDQSAAVEEWSDLADAAVEAVPQRMQEHFSLISWWDPVGLLDRPVATPETALACFVLAWNLARASLGNRSANLRRAIQCYRAALGVYTEKDATDEWVAVQGGLGAALLLLTTGDRAENLRQAMECFRVVEPYAGESMDPDNFAGQQGLLGLGWFQLPTGNRAENLGRAMECLRAALRIFTVESSPAEWAMAQNVMGMVWLALPTGERAENVHHAMECFTASLGVLTDQQHPQHWAITQRGLGFAWSELPAKDLGERSENLRRASECFDAALRIFTEQSFPTDWALIQSGLGNVWSHLPSGAAVENLGKAIECYEAALRYLSEKDFPEEWASAQSGLGHAWLQLPAEDRTDNLRHAIECYRAAQRVHTEKNRPRDWATAERYLGKAWLAFPAAEDGESLRNAIACFQAALQVFTEQDVPAIWAAIQDDLGDAWFALPGPNSAENLRRAVECYQAASRIFTEQDAPASWARLQNNSGVAQLRLARLGYTEELRHAIAFLHAALRVYTQQKYPQQHSASTGILQRALDLLEQSATASGNSA